MDFRSITYSVSGRRATITLNRPERMNAIDRHMPREIAEAVAAANEDNDVHVIVLAGAGKGFCGGYADGVVLRNRVVGGVGALLIV